MRRNEFEDECAAHYEPDGRLACYLSRRPLSKCLVYSTRSPKSSVGSTLRSSPFLPKTCQKESPIKAVGQFCVGSHVLHWQTRSWSDTGAGKCRALEYPSPGDRSRRNSGARR